MGLAERRGVEAVKQDEFKEFETNVKNICGFDVKLTMDWNALENQKECVWICENKKTSYFLFNYITEALKKVCADSIGKEAVKSALKEISMFPVAGDVDFFEGVLTIRNDLTGQGAYQADQIQEKLEKGL